MKKPGHVIGLFFLRMYSQQTIEKLMRNGSLIPAFAANERVFVMYFCRSDAFGKADSKQKKLTFI
jgi:hypothetical protein